jgi:hypothetical protein
MNGYQLVGDGQMNRWSPEDFRGSETILEVTVVLDTCHYTLVQTSIMQHTKCDTKVQT